MAKTVKLSTLYTLIVKPDNSFEMLVDNVSMKNGSLLEDFSPSVNPEKEIDDKDDKKPDDWVDQARIPDPDATKPEDWDEDEPLEVVDTEATKPDDWLEDEPTSVPDPEAEKPEDWDDEEDGDWIPPTVPNPKCEEASGCGKWEPPMIKNPKYKGKWTAEYIDNPAYKGVWAPRKIANPDYFEDKTPANFEPMGAVSHLFYQLQANILMIFRSASKSGPCKRTFCLTIFTSVIQSKMLRPSERRPGISNVRLRMPKKLLPSQRKRTSRSLQWTSVSKTTQSRM
jgi:calnexin